MSTADKFNKLIETKEAIKQAIIEKGVEIDNDTIFADYPFKIISIKTGDGDNTLFNIITKNNTDYSYLFYNYSEDIDLSNINVDNVIDMSNMFNGCLSNQINLSNLNLSNIASFNDMFTNCENLTTIIMENSDYKSINKIISVLPTKENNQGVMYVKGVDDFSLVNKELARSKYWDVEEYPTIATYTFDNSVDVLPIFDEDYEYNYTDVDNGDNTITRTIT